MPLSFSILYINEQVEGDVTQSILTFVTSQRDPLFPCVKTTIHYQGTMDINLHGNNYVGLSIQKISDTAKK